MPIFSNFENWQKLADENERAEKFAKIGRHNKFKALVGL